jgi:hypothetical protein
MNKLTGIGKLVAYGCSEEIEFYYRRLLDILLQERYIPGSIKRHILSFLWYEEWLSKRYYDE